MNREMSFSVLCCTKWAAVALESNNKMSEWTGWEGHNDRQETRLKND